MPDQARQQKAFEYLQAHAASGEPFTPDELKDAIGWKMSTVKTYVFKQFADYLEPVDGGGYRVARAFNRLSWKTFQQLVTQVKHPLARYDRATYHHVVVYDVLMPLTREDKLRRALDELFYRDTLELRIKEIGLHIVNAFFPRKLGENDPEFVARVIQFVDERIGGFSISHVGGRFRVGRILSRTESGARLASDEPYLIDETTAIVRFIIPCLASKAQHDGDFELGEPTSVAERAVEDEIRQIRRIFFEIFVEALVPTILGENLIWMLETTRQGQRLYELSLTERSKRRAAAMRGELAENGNEASGIDEEDD